MDLAYAACGDGRLATPARTAEVECGALRDFHRAAAFAFSARKSASRTCLPARERATAHRMMTNVSLCLMGASLVVLGEAVSLMNAPISSFDDAFERAVVPR
jgi:hypothetical protein